MYNLLVTYTAKDSQTLRAFYKEVSEAGIIEETHKEEGNLRYDYFFSCERDNEILIMEKWVDKEAQVYHDGLPHLVTLGKIKEKYGIETAFEEIGE